MIPHAFCMDRAVSVIYFNNWRNIIKVINNVSNWGFIKKVIQRMLRNFLKSTKHWVQHDNQWKGTSTEVQTIPTLSLSLLLLDTLCIVCCNNKFQAPSWNRNNDSQAQILSFCRHFITTSLFSLVYWFKKPGSCMVILNIFALFKKLY